jgi:hypothetical protein
MHAFPCVIAAHDHELVVGGDRVARAVAPNKIHALVRVPPQLNETLSRIRCDSGAAHVHFSGSERKQLGSGWHWWFWVPTKIDRSGFLMKLAKDVREVGQLKTTYRSWHARA